jgi:hypothetical protein
MSKDRCCSCHSTRNACKICACAKSGKGCTSCLLSDGGFCKNPHGSALTEKKSEF